MTNWYTTWYISNHYSQHNLQIRQNHTWALLLIICTDSSFYWFEFARCALPIYNYSRLIVPSAGVINHSACEHNGPVIGCNARPRDNRRWNPQSWGRNTVSPNMRPCVNTLWHLLGTIVPANRPFRALITDIESRQRNQRPSTSKLSGCVDVTTNYTRLTFIKERTPTKHYSE